MKPATRNELTQDEARRPGRKTGLDIVALRDAWASKSYKQFGTFRAYCKAIHGISHSAAYGHLTGNRILGASRPWISEALRWSVWERDNFTCKYCGRRQFLSLDHIIPISNGGTTDEANLVTACRKCNSTKGKQDAKWFCDPLSRSMRIWKEIFR